MPRLRRIMTAVLTVGLVTTAPPAAAETGPVFRDGFEAPGVSRPFERFAAGRHLGPWTVTEGDAELSTTARWQAGEGRQSLDLNGTVAATFAVSPLTTYRISYAVAGNPAAAPRVKTGKVRVGDRTAQRFSFDTGRTSASRMDYGRRALYVVAVTSPMRLEFVGPADHVQAGHLSAGSGPVLDDVRVDSCQVVLCPARTPATRG